MKKLNIIYLSHSPGQKHYKNFFKSLEGFEDDITLWVAYSKPETDKTDYEKTYSDLYKGKISFLYENKVRNGKIFEISKFINDDEYCLVIDADDKLNKDAMKLLLKEKIFEQNEDVIYFNSSKRFNPQTKEYFFIRPSLIAVDFMIFKNKILKLAANTFLEEEKKEGFLIEDKFYYKPIHMSETFLNLAIIINAKTFRKCSFSPYLYKQFIHDFTENDSNEKKYREEKLKVANGIYASPGQVNKQAGFNFLDNLFRTIVEKENYDFRKSELQIILEEFERISKRDKVDFDDKYIRNKINNIKMRNSITICSDLKNDIEGAKTLIYSIKNNSDIDNINLISTSDSNISFFTQLCNELNIKFYIYLIDNIMKEINYRVEKSKKYNELEHINTFAFARMLIPKVIVDYENTLYLDTDTFIYGKLNFSKMLRKTKKNFGVINNGKISPEYWFEKYDGIYKDINETKKLAFNSGVILFKWIKDKEERDFYFEKFMNSLEKNSFMYMDQAHLNHCLKGEVSYLPMIYNYPFHNLKKDIVKKIKNPIIVHFASKNKPWNYEYKSINNIDNEWLNLNRKINEKKN